MIAAVWLAECPASAETVYGEAKQLGGGLVQVHAELAADGSPRVLGVSFGEGVLQGPPAVPNNHRRCFDMNGNGKIDARGECNGDFELISPLPNEMAKRSETPFKWVSVNWDPEGHPPSGAAALGRAGFRLSLLHSRP